MVPFPEPSDQSERNTRAVPQSIQENAAKALADNLTGEDADNRKQKLLKISKSKVKEAKSQQRLNIQIEAEVKVSTFKHKYLSLPPSLSHTHKHQLTFTHSLTFILITQMHDK